MTGFGDYDRWKTREPDWDARECPNCGEYLRWWECSWCCDSCDDEDEYLQRQIDEQEAMEVTA